MARPTRLTKRIPLKYSEDEYILQLKPRKSRKTNADNNATSRTQEPSKESRVASAKGNSRESDGTISIFGSPVLRDRTNLAKPTLKSDVLKKKGTSEERSGKKPTKQNTLSNIESKSKTTKIVDIENYAARIRTRRVPNVEKEAGSNDSSPKKSLRRSLDTRKQEERVVSKRKFFKNKAPGVPNAENIEPEKKVPSGKRKIVARDKLKFDNSFKLRQTTLQESFMKQNAKKNLRPRQAAKNYHEESTILEKSKVATVDDKTNERKLPIYKTVKLTEGRENNPSEIYEFEYNSNDSLEKMAKKRKKRRLGTRVIPKKSKATAKKFASDAKATARTLVVKNDEAKNEKKIDDVPSGVENVVDFSPIEFNEPPQEINVTTKQATKPIVVECLELKGDARINSAALRNSGESRKNDRQGLRATSAFLVEPTGLYKTMSNHVLLNKSLSPISKAIDSFDPGSPWRAPTLPIYQFSRVKGIVQSTPQISSPMRNVGDSGKTVSTFRTMIANKIEKNSENSSPQLVDKPTPKKSAKITKSPRKFGTEISNAAPRFGAKTINESPEKKGSNLSDENVVKVAKSPRKFGTEISNVKVSKFVTKAIDSPNETSDENVKIAKSPRKFGTEISNVKLPKFVTKTIDSSNETSDENIKIAKSPRKFGTEISNVKNSKFITKAIIENPNETSDENIKIAKSPRKFGTEISNVKNSKFITKAIIENPNEISDEKIKIAKSPRKFGTEISNVNKLNFVTKAIIESPNEITSNDTDENIAKIAKSPKKFPTEISNASFDVCGIEEMGPSDVIDDNADDKENSLPSKKDKSLESPRKQQSNSCRSPTKLSTKTNFVPQAGPSGLQKRIPLTESRILKQSNLNNFLNLEKVPTSTRITTIHGIFDDADSEPINGKTINPRITKDANVENAFGFDDDADDADDAPIIRAATVKFAKPNVRKRIVAKAIDNKNESTRSDPLTARLSVGEIKKHLQLSTTVEKNDLVNDPIERMEREENQEQHFPTSAKPLTFSDTFDLSIATNETHPKENLLFADLEPVHFKQPPRHLYKRKRAAARIAYSDDEDEDRNVDVHADEHVNHSTKRRKITKIEKQRQKKIEEWAKDLNETFEEIDHFDLIVE